MIGGNVFPLDCEIVRETVEKGQGSLSLNDLILDGVSDHFTDGMKLQFAHDVSAVGFRGFYADAESDGNFLAAFSFGEELDDFTFARGEAVAGRDFRLRGGGLTGKVVEQHRGSAGGEKSSVTGDGFDCGDQITVSVGLENVAARAGLDDVANKLIGEVHREDEDAGLGKGFVDAARGFEAVEVRHADVHDDDVRLELLDEGDRLAAGFGFGADFPALLGGQQAFEAAADDVVIINDEDFECVHKRPDRGG